MATVKAVLATLADAIELGVNTITSTIQLVCAVFVAQRILTCCPYIKPGIDNIATVIPATFHTVAAVGGLGQTGAE